MIIGTFNGWNIVGLPASPAPMQVEWDIDDKIGEVESPFTGSGQLQDWGSDRWSVKIAMPPMPQAQAAPWYAWLMEIRGKLNVFPLGDPLGTAPAGAALGAPVCTAGNTTRSRTLLTSGWQPSTNGQLLVGDYLQIGQRLHCVIGSNVDSDGSGNASINIWPAIREAPMAGDSVILSNPTGLFRLQKNQRGWSLAVSKMFGVKFDAKEAL